LNQQSCLSKFNKMHKTSFEFWSFLIRVCFGQFNKIRRNSNFEFGFVQVGSASVPTSTGVPRGPPYSPVFSCLLSSVV
jgi:hypothetical protein